MLVGEQLGETIATLIEIDVFDLVTEHHGELIFAVHVGEDAGADEDLSAGEADGAAERRAGIEAEAVGEFAQGMSRDAVADGLEIFVEPFCLRSRRHAFLGHEVVGEDFAEADFVGVGERWWCWWSGSEKGEKQEDCGKPVQVHIVMDGPGIDL